MDLQLYEIEVQDYLVYFRNLGYKLPPQTMSVQGEAAVNNTRHAASLGAVATSLPFLFLDCA
jgi:hypothetical protein